MRLNKGISLYESFQANLKEATDNKEWEEVCKEFCKKIGAELLFVNDDNFGYEDKNGKLVHMYADELERYLKANEIYNKGEELSDEDAETIVGALKDFEKRKDTFKEAYKYHRTKLNETTNKGIQSMKDAYHEKVRKAKEENGVEEYRDLPDDVKEELDKEDRVIWCIEMIHSILTYTSERNIEELIKDKYLQSYIEDLGEEKVRELLANEIEEFSKATINKGVHTDSEGVTYNSVTFSDDLNEADESNDNIEDISWILEEFNYPPDVESEERFKGDRDSYYFTVVTSVSGAEKFNYHSDYWGSAEGYQEEAVRLLEYLKPYMRKKVKFTFEDGQEMIAKVKGVAIDKQYNSISHMKILVDEIK